MPARGLLAFGALMLAVAGGAVHPFGAVKQNQPAPLLKGSPVDRATLERIQRACADCHSGQGRWPWYSYLAPASWLVERDVSQARAQLNLSRWAAYSTREQITLLTAMGAAVRSRAMPPSRYTALHPGAALSAEERQSVYEWVKGERHRLASSLRRAGDGAEGRVVPGVELR